MRFVTALFICILLVVMATSDAEVTMSQPLHPSTRMQQNVSNSSSIDNSRPTDVTTTRTLATSSVTDVSNLADDGDVQTGTSNGVARADNKTTDKSVAGISCRLNVDQYDCLNNKLTEIALQLERLQTAANNLDISASTKTVAECPEGFAESDSGCHRIVTDILPWSIATLRCQALHPRAHLVAIDNQREQQTLAAIISQRLQSEKLDSCELDGAYGLWTAGQRLDIQSCHSPFVWKLSPSSMAEMRYSHWCAGQPNFWRGQESCAHIYVRSDDTDINCMNDIYCGTEMCSICEVDL